MLMSMRLPLSILRCNRLGRRENEPAGFDALGADQVVGQTANLSGRAAKQDHFQASVAIEMNMSRGHDLIEMIVLQVGQSPGDSADVVVVDEGDDSHRLAFVLRDRLFNQCGPHQPADGFAAIGITVKLAITIEQAK